MLLTMSPVRDKNEWPNTHGHNNVDDDKSYIFDVQYVVTMIQIRHSKTNETTDTEVGKEKKHS